MFDDLKKKLLEEIEIASNLDELSTLRLIIFGRRGEINKLIQSIKDLPIEERSRQGREINQLKSELNNILKQRETILRSQITDLSKEWIDVTAPAIKASHGHLHPLEIVRRQIEDIFQSMGFAIIEGPEIETEWYNFDALNIPASHPSRDLWDTFWISTEKKDGNSLAASKELESMAWKFEVKGEDLVMRTHTSPVQIRFMQENNPPFRIIVPGKTFRHEATDPSHDIQFFQIEGLMVDKNISVANFKAVLEEFFSRLFAKGIKLRLRPSYFPFTEPSFEVDISCVKCNQDGCSLCKEAGWIEMMGAGMVHPKVFEFAGYNPRDWQGFAFGMGLDRIAMMKYGIDDIRLFNSGDLRFLRQF